MKPCFSPATQLIDVIACYGKDGRPCIASVFPPLYLRLSLFHFPPATKGTVDSGQIHKPYCSITHWSIWGSIQLHCLHNWSRPLCCGKHFTRLASILINSLLLIMYLIDQFGPRVNWSIILIFFFFCRGIKWGANCSGLNVCFACSLGYCNELPNDLPSSGVMRYHSKYGVSLKHDTNAKRQGLSVFQNKGKDHIV